GVEAAAVEINKDEIFVRGRRVECRDDVDGDAGESLLLDVDGENAAGFGGIFGAPGVGSGTALGESLRLAVEMVERLEPLLRFGADRGRRRDRARNVNGAVGVGAERVLRSGRQVSGGRAFRVNGER